MTRYLLDSDAVIDILYGIGETVTVVQRLHAEGGILSTCAVVTAEVYSGLAPHEHVPAVAFLRRSTFCKPHPTQRGRLAHGGTPTGDAGRPYRPRIASSPPLLWPTRQQS